MDFNLWAHKGAILNYIETSSINSTKITSGNSDQKLDISDKITIKSEKQITHETMKSDKVTLKTISMSNGMKSAVQVLNIFEPTHSFVFNQKQNHVNSRPLKQSCANSYASWLLCKLLHLGWF